MPWFPACPAFGVHFSWGWIVVPGRYDPVGLVGSEVHLFPTGQPMVFAVNFILRYEVHSVYHTYFKLVI
jgi:hypothetical protein